MIDSPSYTPPVSHLLTYGEYLKYGFKPGTHYLDKFGLTAEHIPELIRMASDDELQDADPDSLESWGPLHAWRALGELKAEEAIQPLISLISPLKDNDWLLNELPNILANIGPPALPKLRDYLANPDFYLDQRSIASEALELIGTEHPKFRQECVNILTDSLKNFSQNCPGLNGFIICSLLGLQAVESASVMEAAYAAHSVDPLLPGDWETVQVELGLKEPKPKLNNPVKWGLTEPQQKLNNPPGIPTLFEKNPKKRSQTQDSSGFGSAGTQQKSGNKKKKKRK